MAVMFPDDISSSYLSSGRDTEMFTDFQSFPALPLVEVKSMRKFSHLPILDATLITIHGFTGSFPAVNRRVLGSHNVIGHGLPAGGQTASTDGSTFIWIFMLSSKYFGSADTTVLVSRKLHLANGDTGVMNKSEQLNNGEKSDVTTASLKVITTLYPSLEKRASINHRVCVGLEVG
jgi:hypothetical protein